MKFDGITTDAMLLLAENRFRDSRDFYEENKERIKALAVNPMRQIAAALGDQLYELDPYMNLDPSRMVSRVRRDTRFTKDQHLYRENLWIMFMRHKNEWPHFPCMWFEFTPRGYSLGIGLFYQTPGLLEFWRSEMREKPAEFKKAVKLCESVGAHTDGEHYKRPKEGCPKGLEDYYNLKEVYFSLASGNTDDLKDETIINRLKECYSAFEPMYRFMLRVSEKYVESKGGLEACREKIR